MKTSSKHKAFALAFTIKGAAVLATAAVLALLFTGCPNSAGGEDVGSFEDAGDFVKIIPPTRGIVGLDPDYTLPGNEAKWKGVFIKDRTVKLSTYMLGKTEVTYKLWKEVYDWAVQPGHGYKFENPGQKGKDGTGSEDEPVTYVSWRDCMVWCNAYTEKEKGIEQCVYRRNDDAVLKDATAENDCKYAEPRMDKKGFRLPTAAEGEYAARWQGSDSTNAAQYGDVWLTKVNSASGAKDKWNTAETGEVAWYSGNSDSKTHPVGEKRKNALGLHDMSGNVREWCWDWYKESPTDEDYVQDGIVIDPNGPDEGTSRVLRGGSWFYSAGYCSVGLRNSSSPNHRSSDLGFRLACRP